jgi:hypothetical protein
MLVPWQSVSLKHPGAVPAGGVTSGFIVEFAPAVWHLAHSGAFDTSVCVWFGCASVVPVHGLEGCGALVWQVLQDVAGPLSKVVPWHFAHRAKPAIANLSVVFTASCAPPRPCCMGSAQPAGWFTPFAWQLKQLTFEMPPASAGLLVEPWQFWHCSGLAA